MNDFGGTLGGPLRFGHLLSAANPAFFFISYEGLRLPRETPILLSVPSMDMRNGNSPTISRGQGVAAIYAAGRRTPLDPTAVPVSPISANLLTYLMPVPNYGPSGLLRQQLPDQLPLAHLLQSG